MEEDDVYKKQDRVHGIIALQARTVNSFDKIGGGSGVARAFFLLRIT